MAQARDDAYRQFSVRFRGEGAREAADRLVAETWAAGASGHEERDWVEAAAERDVPVIEVVVYAPAARCAAVWGVARNRAPAVGPSFAVEPVDWLDRWRRGLRATVVAGRLVVRPSSLEHALLPGQEEIIVEPGQAFGTGGHASTRLILEWLVSDEVQLEPSVRVLDVGVGSGVLALAALRLGAGRAIGFDLDARAVREAARAGRENRLADRLGLMAGPIDALKEVKFELVLANLLKLELLPLRDRLVSRLAPGGSLLVSGLLRDEQPQVEAELTEVGLACVGVRAERDATGDEWVALRLLQG
ncbi:MAG: 50S ribosomal protein L11 methyltransferase [Myxococcota bacterium]